MEEAARLSRASAFLVEVADLLSTPGGTWGSRAVASPESLGAVVSQRDGLFLAQCDVLAVTRSVAPLAWI